MVMKETVLVLRRQMLKYLGMKCLSICKLLSNGSAIYIYAKTEGDRKIKQMCQVLTGKLR